MTIELTAAGSVTDYGSDVQTIIRQTFADASQVELEKVRLSHKISDMRTFEPTPTHHTSPFYPTLTLTHNKVALAIVPASVLMSIEIEHASAANAAASRKAISSKLESARAATAFLAEAGVTVTSDPIIQVSHSRR